MLLHWGQNAQMALYATIVVVGDITSDHMYKLFPACKPSTEVSLPFQDSPESFHRAIVNTFCNPGHTLSHAGFFKFLVKCSVGVLKTTIAMEQRMCVRICFYSLIKGLEHKRIVVAVTYDIGNNSPVTKIQNRTQVDFMNFNSFIPFEFRNIGKPLFVGMLCVKLTVQTVLCYILRILGLPGTSMVVVLNCRFHILCPANS